MKNDDNLMKLYNELIPALAKAAVGDFKSDLQIRPENDPRVNELLMGVQVLLDVINEKMDELEQTQLGATKPSERPVMLLDEVLKKTTD